MRFERRRFVEVAALGAAGIMAGCRRDAEKPAVPPPPGARQPPGRTLQLALWGSCLYAFSKDGQQLEIAYLTEDPQIADCPLPSHGFVPHKPMLDLDGFKIEFPPGVYRVASSSIAAEAAVLSSIDLKGAAAGCPTSGDIESLGYVPTLAAMQASVGANWHQRFSTRIIFDRGTVRARKPLVWDYGLAEFTVRGPGGATSGNVVFTDTLELTLPLAGDELTFESEGGKLVTVRTTQDTSVIHASLMAHPSPPDDAPPDMPAGQPAPHICALYAAFEHPPAMHNRAEFYFEGWCKASGATLQAAPQLFSPGKYCTGAKIIL